MCEPGVGGLVEHDAIVVLALQAPERDALALGARRRRVHLPKKLRKTSILVLKVFMVHDTCVLRA